MLSGRRLDLLDPSPFDIEIEDIAHGLAFVARWNGQTKGDYPYSVAEHSLLVEEIFVQNRPNSTANWRLAALLHDAPEFVIGDMISPVKGAIGTGYESLERRLTEAVRLRFGLPTELPRAIEKSIKKADKLSAWLEATQIAGFSHADANKHIGYQRTAKGKELKVLIRPPAAVRSEFKTKMAELLNIMDSGIPANQRKLRRLSPVSPASDIGSRLLTHSASGIDKTGRSQG